MYTLLRRRGAAPIAVMLAVVLTALATVPASIRAQTTPAGHRDYVHADVVFVQGMILHHAQAVVMSDWASNHGARPDLALLCKRIALSQRDEITMMQHWLEERHLDTPDPLHMLKSDSNSAQGSISTSGMTGMSGMGSMSMPGMDMGPHPMLMTGMLTPEEMRRLDAARGPAFDRLYLTGMIKHHQGALDMVATLFATPGAGQQPELFSFATDVDAGQRAEMARMEALLNTLTSSQTR
jgi:uncharacterized protein (DUF305 family)